jgi:hypothetical protein
MKIVYVKEGKSPDGPLYPYEYSDLMGGTSTGG